MGAKCIKCFASIFHGTFGDFTQPCFNGLFRFRVHKAPLSAACLRLRFTSRENSSLKCGVKTAAPWSLAIHAAPQSVPGCRGVEGPGRGGRFSSTGDERGHFLEHVASAPAHRCRGKHLGSPSAWWSVGSRDLPKSAAGVSRVNHVKWERAKILEKERIHGSNL